MRFLLLTIATLLVVGAVHTLTPERLRFWSFSAFGFAVAYAAICAANCVIQFTFVQQRSLSRDLAGLETWASANPHSALFATDQLAFFFQGLATLLLAPLFDGNLIARIIEWQFVLNGLFTVIGVVATALGSYAGPDGQFLYTASVLPWGINLAVAFGLLALACDAHRPGKRYRLRLRPRLPAHSLVRDHPPHTGRRGQGGAQWSSDG